MTRENDGPANSPCTMQWPGDNNADLNKRPRGRACERTRRSMECMRRAQSRNEQANKQQIRMAERDYQFSQNVHKRRTPAGRTTGQPAPRAQLCRHRPGDDSFRRAQSRKQRERWRQLGKATHAYQSGPMTQSSCRPGSRRLTAEWPKRLACIKMWTRSFKASAEHERESQ